MTWDAVCPTCKGKYFLLTQNTDNTINVNCANGTCYKDIGRIPAGIIDAAIIPESGLAIGMSGIEIEIP